MSRFEKVRAVLLVVLVVAAVALVVVLLSGRPWLLDLVAWARRAGATGVLVFVGCYIASTLLLVPMAVPALVAGFLYGPLWGTLLVVPTHVLSSAIAFQLGRTIARPWICRFIARHPRLALFDRGLGQQGFRLVFLMRLSPVAPFNVLNYALAVTDIHLSDYLLATFLGTTPGALATTYAGSLLTNASELTTGRGPDTPTWERTLYFVGLVCTIAVTALIARIARRALDRTLTPS